MISYSLPPRWVLDSFGSMAGLCTTVSLLPQLIRIWRRKSASDVSLAMFLLFSFGVACWLVYGLGIGSIPVMAANATTLTLATIIIVTHPGNDHHRPQASLRSPRNRNQRDSHDKPA